VLAAPSAPSAGQNTARILVAVFAHPDDESSAAPILARYAREGAQVHLIVATDGAAGGQQTSVAAGAELAKVRADEARCAADALGIKPPILLEFPDGKLGAYGEDPLLVTRLVSQFVNGMEGKDKNGELLPGSGGFHKTVTTIKHYAANNSEIDRLTPPTWTTGPCASTTRPPSAASSSMRIPAR